MATAAFTETTGDKGQVNVEQMLAPQALVRPPVGASKPLGWLKNELELQAAGLTGQLPHFWPYINDSSWVGGAGFGGTPHQSMGYYLQGLVPLSYMLPDDANLRNIRERYVGYILAAQNETETSGGWLGGAVEAGAPSEYWSKYEAVEALEMMAEADPEAAARWGMEDALVRHHAAFHQALVVAQSPPLNASREGFSRYSDALAGIEWLLDRGSGGAAANAMLWELADTIRREADAIMRDGAGYSWQEFFAAGDPFAAFNDSEATGASHLLHHGVDIGQAMKTGALWWRFSGAAGDLAGPAAALEWADAYLHLADGMHFADGEVSAPHTPSRGTETCSVVETLHSMRVAYEVTGDVRFYDRLEKAAFNALPAALWPDVTANAHLHASNEIGASVGTPFGYGLDACGSANVHQGWPQLGLAPVLIDPHHGALVVAGFAPSVTGFADEGFSLTVEGQYPFADAVRLRLTTPRGARPVAQHDLRVRVPCWSDSATISVGEGRARFFRGCRLASLGNVTIPGGGGNLTVDVRFAQRVQVYTWGNASSQEGASVGAVEIHRGPLAFALRPNATVTETRIAGSESCAQRTVDATGAPWNYALDLSLGLEFVETGAGVPAVPFDGEARPPVVVRVSARRLPEWTADGDRPPPPPNSPVTSSEPLETLELVPFGSTNVRISTFPVLSASLPRSD